jgi:hypothetical protein
MKKGSSKHIQPVEDILRKEYDFSQAVRGQHYRPLHEGYTIKIHKADGTTEVQQVVFEPGTVRLDPDLQEYFPDSQAVNRTLRSLLTMMRQLQITTESEGQKAAGYLARERADNLDPVNR